MKKFLLISCSLIFLVALGFSQAPPSPPMNVYGTVAEDGNGALDKAVEIRFNGSSLANDSTDENGFYDLYIPYSSDYSGRDLEIFVAGDYERNVSFESGESVREDFTGDYRAPRVSDVDVARVANESVLIEWETDEESITELVYGLEDGDIDTVEEDKGEYNTTHQLNISGLSKGTTYEFKVVGEDSAGNRLVDDKGGSFYDFTTNGGSGKEEEQEKQQKQKQGQNQTQQQPGQEDQQTGSGDREVSSSLESGEAEVDVGSVSRGSEAVMSFEGGEALDEISFSAASDMSDVVVDVRELDSRPENIPSAGTVYRYKQIDLSSSSGEVSGASFSFRVNRAWLTNSRATVEDIVLKRYSSEGWQDLDTEYTGIDGDHYRFRAESPGFSYFAIGIRNGSTTPIALENVSVSPLSGQVPLNMSINGVLVNTEDSEASRTVTASIGGNRTVSEEFTLEAGERRNFSMNLVVEEPGSYDLNVGGEVFRVEASQNSFLAYILLVLLFLMLSGGGIAAYLQYTGRIDFEDLLLDHVGGEQERIEVEDGEFTFTGSSDSDSGQEVDGYVSITVGFDGDEPTLREKRVYRQADRHGEYDWENAIEEDISGVEEEMSKRIRKFVHEVKEEQSDGLVCSLCMEEFDTEDGLHLHQAISHDIRCDVCGEKFETVRGLHIHQGMTHHEISHDLYQ